MSLGGEPIPDGVAPMVDTKPQKLELDPMDPARVDVVLNRYAKSHVIHNKGAIIFTGSGVGKTTYCNRQEPGLDGKTDFIDMDLVYKEAGAPPCEEHKPGTPGYEIKPFPWWTWGDNVIRKVEERCDMVNEALIKKGLWGLTTSFTPEAECQPTAIVMLPWEEHKKRIEQKWSEGNADGGAKPDEAGFKLVQGHRKWTEEVAQRNNIPVFDSIENQLRTLYN